MPLYASACLCRVGVEGVVCARHVHCTLHSPLLFLPMFIQLTLPLHVHIRTIPKRTTILPTHASQDRAGQEAGHQARASKEARGQGQDPHQDASQSTRQGDEEEGMPSSSADP